MTTALALNRLTVEELAEREGVTVQAVHAWINNRRAPTSYKIGKRRLFDMEDVIAWENARKAATRR